VRARLVAAVLVASAVALIGVRPASALPVVAFHSPNLDDVLPVSNPTISADVSSAGGNLTGRIRLRVDWAEDGVDRPAVWESGPVDGKQAQSVSFSVPLPLNGRYVATIDATDSTLAPLNEAHTERAFFLAAPPAVPAGVRAILVSGKVTVSWARNPEPDIVGYRVQRSGGGAPAVLGTTKETTFTDPGPPAPGGYQVVALRRGARPGEEVASAPSASASIGSGGGRGGPPAPLGKIDLAKFQQLLAEAQRQAAAGAEPMEDGAFEANLPYASAADEEELGSGEAEVPGGPALPFVAAGLLVLDAFLLLRAIRSQVSRSLAT
jgi:hypothetical protein